MKILELAIMLVFLITIPIVILVDRNMDLSADAKSKKSAEEYVRYGDELFNKGRLYYNDASIQYWEALKQNPKLAGARFRLAEIYYEYIWNNETIYQLEELKKINPEFPGLHLLMGKTYNRMGDNNKAFMAFQNAIAIKPSDAEAYYYLGTIYQQRNVEEDAIRAYEAAVLFLSSQTGESNAESVVKAYTQLGRIYKGRKELKKAEYAFRKAFEIDPSSVEVISELKNLYEQEAGIFKSQKKFDEAAKKYEEMLKLDPDNSENSWIYVELGSIYRSQELYNKAITAYSMAAKLDPLNYDAFSAIKELKILKESN